MTEVNYLTLGSNEAPIQVESFINFACPYCKNYFRAAEKALKPFIEAGKVQHVIKHFDKTKQALLKGTVANIHLDYQKVNETIEVIHDLYDTQDEWKKSFTAIEEKMTQAFNLAPNKAADARSLAINEETFKRGIKGIPTVFINEVQFEFNPLEDKQSDIETLITDKINQLSK